MFSLDYMYNDFDLNNHTKNIINQMLGLRTDMFIVSNDYFLLNDDTNDVSQDHLGIVNILFYVNNQYKMKLDSNEKNNTNVEWKSLEELHEDLKSEHNYESWS